MHNVHFASSQLSYMNCALNSLKSNGVMHGTHAWYHCLNQCQPIVNWTPVNTNAIITQCGMASSLWHNFKNNNVIIALMRRNVILMYLWRYSDVILVFVESNFLFEHMRLNRANRINLRCHFSKIREQWVKKRDVSQKKILNQTHGRPGKRCKCEIRPEIISN